MRKDIFRKVPEGANRFIGGTHRRCMDIEPIAHIRTDFREKFGIPRQSGYAEGCVGRIVFEPKYRNPDSVRCLEGFSHIWLIFDFSECHRDGWSPMVRPPRLGGNEKVGVFASRSPFRPNSLGLSSVRLLSVDETDEGPVLTVSGADLLDGTPIYDIKPYVRHADSHPDAVSGFANAPDEHRLTVSDPDDLLSVMDERKRLALIECLELDPRPSYQDDDRTYTMMFSEFDVSFTVGNGVLTVTGIRRL